MTTSFRTFLALLSAAGLIALSGPAPACAETGRVALTFDDLPGLSLVPD
eukprot:gene16320-19289_t